MSETERLDYKKGKNKTLLEEVLGNYFEATGRFTDCALASSSVRGKPGVTRAIGIK